MNIITENQSVSLYYREGSSDKVYQASIESAGDGFAVNFAYGRRGTTLNTGTKTNTPVDHETATRIFEKLVSEKKAKGYTEGPNGTPYQHSDKQPSGVLPQLLNPIDEAQVNQLVQGYDYCAQEKYDGRRVLLRKTGQEIQGINRKGLVIGLPELIVNAAKVFPDDWVMDGECVGNMILSFDLLEHNSATLMQEAYHRRYLVLMNLRAKAMQRNIELAETAFTPKQKRQMLDLLRKQNKEGIVFKRLDAPYTPGRPNSGGNQFKHKFYATCSAVVAKVNDKRSVEVRLLNGKGWNNCGNVTIPANHSVPPVGAVVEIRYLYAFNESNALYQPVYLGLRTDVDQHECVLSQLKYKPTEVDEC